MPDSAETAVHGDEWRDLEERFRNGDPPGPDFGAPIHTDLTVPPGAAAGEPTIRIQEWFYSSVTCNPPPEQVLEECDKCDGHSHRVKVLFGPMVGTPPGGLQGPGVEDQQHVPDDHYGRHLGERFVDSRCRGTETTRTKMTYSLTGRIYVTWKTKTIDHVKNGFVWRSPISENPCADKRAARGEAGESIEEALGGRPA